MVIIDLIRITSLDNKYKIKSGHSFIYVKNINLNAFKLNLIYYE